MTPKDDRRPVLLTLVGAVACVMAAIGIVYTKHESRELFVELEDLSDTRDELNHDWERLRIEHGMYTDPSTIEKRGLDDLGLSVPEPMDINVIEQP